MIGTQNVGKLVSFCGVMLGLLLVYNIAPPLVAEGSDVVAGWGLVYQGDPCYTNTYPLYCSGGDEYGVKNCGGNPGPLQGVIQRYPNPGSVNLLGNAGCANTGRPESVNCSLVCEAECI